MPSSRTVSSMAARLVRPSSTSRAFSAAKSSAPCAKPWVNEAMQMPPLRPVAWPATAPASSTTTSAPGSSSLASSAVHRPVKPAPMTARSQVSAPVSAGRGAGAAAPSSQNGAGRAPRKARRARPETGVSAEACRGSMVTTLPVARCAPGLCAARRRRGRSGAVGRDGRPHRAAGPAARPAPRLVDVVPGPHAPQPRSGARAASTAATPHDQQRARILLRGQED